jgi:hypothetical protein
MVYKCYKLMLSGVGVNGYKDQGLYVYMSSNGN